MTCPLRRFNYWAYLMKNIRLHYIFDFYVFMYIFFIHYRILNIHETGLMQIWKQKQWPKQNFCAGSLIKEAKPIKWIDIQTAFYLIGIGTIFGIFILGSEFIFSKCRSKKNIKCNTSFCNKVSEWIWSLIWIFEYWCRWIQMQVSMDSTVGVNEFKCRYRWIQQLSVSEFNDWCQWIQRLVSVNSALSISELKCLFRWNQRLMSVNSKADVGDFEGRCRWIQRWMFVKSNEMQAQSISFWRINVNICDIFCYILSQRIFCKRTRYW